MGDQIASKSNDLNRLLRRLAELEAENERLRAALRRAGEPKAQAAPETERARRHRADERVRPERDFTRLIVDNTAEALFLTDEAGRMTFANPAAERMFGWGQEELLGRVLHDVIHHHHAEGRPYPAAACPLVSVLTSGRAHEDHEDVFFRKNGTMVDVACSNAPIIRNGSIVGGVLVVSDITRRKQAEAALRESEERLRLARRAGRLGEWDWDLETDTATQSRRTYRIHGYGAPLPEFTYATFMEHVLPEDREAVDRAVQEAIATWKPLHIERRIRRVDGEQRWIAVYGRRLQGADRMIGVVQDITKRKRAEERQAILIRELNHQVKNMLATVRSIVNLTMRDGGSVDTFRASFGARLPALAKAQDLLTRGDWESASLREIMRGALAPYDSETETRLVINGEDESVGAEAAIALSLTLHELVTNAAKYGALSVPTGCVAVSWTVRRAPEERQLRLTWIESGGPEVRRPSRRGFGSTLIERMLAHQVGGAARLDFEPSGVRFTMETPLRTGVG